MPFFGVCPDGTGSFELYPAAVQPSSVTCGPLSVVWSGCYLNVGEPPSPPPQDCCDETRDITVEIWE